MTGGTHEIEWVTDDRRLAALAAGWDRLVPADGTPFDLHCWYSTWWAAFGGSNELAVCALWRAGELAGVFPLQRAGGELRPLVNEHTCRYRPLAADDEALAALCRAAMAEAPGGFELSSLRADDPALAAIGAATRATRRIPHFEPEFSSPFIETTGELEAWRAETKPRWRAPIERLRRKMGRDHVAELALVERPGDLEAELAEGFRVEASGWKGEEGTAILSAPETEAFYSGIGRAFDERGELYLSRIRLDGDAVAFDLCILHGNRLYLLKTGYDERVRRLAPGLVIRLAVVERCFEAGIASHELLGREMEWKAKFATGNRDFVFLRAYPRTPRGLSRHVYRGSLRPRLKRAYRRLRPPAA